MNRHIGMTVAALALVAVVGVVLVARFAGQGDTSAVSPAAAAQEATPSATETPSPAETPTAIANLRVTEYEVFLSRDPFEPVIVSAPPGGSPEVPPTSPTPGPGDPTPSPAPSPGGPGPDDGCVDDGTVVCDGQVVKLVDVFDDGQPGAVVQIDETVYEVRVGETFAGNYLVRSIDPPCATLLFGDDAFTLCEGESALK